MAICPTCQKEVPADATACPIDGTSLRPTESLLGQVLGDRYRIVRALGEGGMGTVYLAEHVVLGKRFAVKVLRPELSQREDLVRRFQQEAIAASRIGQENIVDIVDFGRTPEGRLYYVMEALDGQSLTTLLCHGQRLPVDRALPLLAQVAKALGAAHGNGIVHRDIKPDNVIVIDRDGTEVVKVLDFGISMVTGDQTSGERITRAGTIIGTPEYMSPEQAGGGALDHRSDVYAWGVLAYEVLTGTLPFSGQSAMDVLVAHKLTPPEPPTGRCPDANIPPEVEALVLAALAKHPDDRPASMTDLARELSRLAAHRAGATTPPPVTPLPAVRPMPTPLLTPAPSAPTLPGEEQRVPHRSRAPLVLLLVVLLAGGVLAYFSYPAAAPGLDPAATAAIPVAEPREPAIVIPPAPMPDPPPSAVATKVSLASVPSGASVTSGGKALGVTPLEVELAGDKARTVRLSLKGYKTVKRKLAPGVAAVEVRLAKARAGEEDDGIGKLNDLKDDPYE